MVSDNKQIDAFKVSLGTHLLSGLVHRFPNVWRRLGNLESWSMREQLESIEIDRPVYVTGLARSGTTILLEILASHPQVATHQYRDFPALFTPYWWGKGNRQSKTAAVERAHADGLMVTASSPEAMEEMLWMACFPDAHNPQVSQLLTEQTANPEFEKLYADHIRKLLLLRNRQRYVAKGNYNLARIGYLKKLRPDAHFVIPVRRPLNHVASLIKQHQLFCAGEQAHPRALHHMRHVGHYEFGLDRRPINVGNETILAEIQELWQQGDETRGWARYWSYLYGWLHDYLDRHPELNESVTIVRYEDLCGSSESTLKNVLDACGLFDQSLFDEWVDRVRAPQYYQPKFTEQDRAIICEETAEVAAKFGYDA